jgi:hypothetical protein
VPKTKLFTVELRADAPPRPECRWKEGDLLGTWKVVAANKTGAIKRVASGVAKPFQLGMGHLVVTDATDDYPKLAGDGTRLVHNFVKPPSYAGGKPTDWEAYTDDGKVWRWVSNDRCLFDDCAAELGVPIDFEAQAAAREADDDAFLASYRARGCDEPSAEERREARAVHGPGKVLVNVLTGRKWTT